MSASIDRRFIISADEPLDNTCSFLPDDVKEDKVCVVAVVGKESSNHFFSKGSITNGLIGKDVFLKSGFGHLSGEPVSNRCQCFIEGYYNQCERTLYLCLNTVHDTTVLVNQCQTLADEISENGVYKFWQKEELQHARSLLFIFHLAHIIVFTQPGSSFDMTYVRFFRTLDNIRVKLQPHLSELIKSHSVSKDWITAARLCSPRVLFAFTRGSQILPADDKKALQRLEHSIEDQIYRILRKSRVITNTSNNSLFAVPNNEEYVHVFTKLNAADNPVDNYLNLLRENCLRSADNESPRSFTHMSAAASSSSLSDFSSSFLSNPSVSGSEFNDFLRQHVDLALTKGFNDNVGRSHVAPIFEIPTLQEWLAVAGSLQNIFFGDTTEQPKVHGHFNTLSSLLDIDNRFSDNRCNKILPHAENTYQEGLPKHYTTNFHQRRLAKAERVFAQHARGPATAKYYQRLQESCDSFWKNGHQLCEEVSLSGRHCVHELHNTPDVCLMNQSPSKPHSSQLKTKAACNCGRTQADRDDPFTHREANFDFYMDLETKCCSHLDCVRFPTFKPSIAEARSGDSLSGQSPMKEMTKPDLTAGMSGLSLALSLGQSGAGGSDLFLHGDQGRLTPTENSVAEAATQEEGAATDQAKDHVTDTERQHSTTEYLAGMVNSNSPPGLLPKFSSWSLCALGKSTAYVPSQGIDQPGFISGSSYLLPWDVTVKCDRDKWPSVGESSSKKGKSRKGQKESSELNLRIYVGVEYECPRGRRFFCSAPDKMIKGSGTQMKETAGKILSSDMPLYFPCTCRSSGQKTCLAQLMRVFVSIPDGPVHLALSPRVQPAPSPCPLYTPEEQAQIKLRPGVLWVLRLPYIYMGDEGPLLPPTDHHLLPACRLLKGLLSIASD